MAKEIRDHLVMILGGRNARELLEAEQKRIGIEGETQRAGLAVIAIDPAAALLAFIVAGMQQILRFVPISAQAKREMMDEFREEEL